MSSSANPPTIRRGAVLLELFRVSLRLGLTSFGGPTAHLGYFHEAYIRRRQWLDEKAYAELVALCQFLPGPASSQVGIGIGLLRGGILGGIVAWLGFTMPSVIALAAFAWLLQGADVSAAGWLHGLKIVAVAIVAHAVLGMGQKLAAGRARASIAVGAASLALLWQAVYAQLAIIIAAGLLGLLLFRKQAAQEAPTLAMPVSRRTAYGCLALFAALLAALPIAGALYPESLIAMADSFYRSGSLVFGGGHVVLPLLEREFVPTGWIDAEQFLAGYAAAQAVPGPLFTFASYIGMAARGFGGAIVATIAIFLPAFLLVAGALPFWNTIRGNARMQQAMTAINAVVVGILLAALYDPLFTTAVQGAADFSLAAVLFVLLVYWKLPPWLIVLLGALSGTLMSWWA
ncbi:chromate efflux transporter [Paenibacillus marinisediminis]